MRTLKDIIDNRQLFESYGIHPLDDNKSVETEEEFIQVLYGAYLCLDRLDLNVINNDSILEKDITDIKFYINNLVCKLGHNKDE